MVTAFYEDEVLPEYREGTRTAMVRSYIGKLRLTIPSEVLLEDQWIPRPHGFKKILMLTKQLEVGPFNAFGLKPVHGERGCTLRLGRLGLLLCLSVEEGLQRLMPVSDSPKFVCGPADALRRKLARMNPLIQMTAGRTGIEQQRRSSNNSGWRPRPGSRIRIWKL